MTDFHYRMFSEFVLLLKRGGGAGGEGNLSPGELAAPGVAGAGRLRFFPT